MGTTFPEGMETVTPSVSINVGTPKIALLILRNWVSAGKLFAFSEITKKGVFSFSWPANFLQIQEMGKPHQQYQDLSFSIKKLTS